MSNTPDKVRTAADGRRVELYGRDSITYPQLVKVFAKMVEDCYNAQRQEVKKEFAAVHND